MDADRAKRGDWRGLAVADAASTMSLRRRQEQWSRRASYVFKANAELVLTNVVVRDAKTGEFVRGLKQSDFTFSRTESRSRSRHSIFRAWTWRRR